MELRLLKRFNKINVWKYIYKISPPVKPDLIENFFLKFARKDPKFYNLKLKKINVKYIMTFKLKGSVHEVILINPSFTSNIFILKIKETIGLKISLVADDMLIDSKSVTDYNVYVKNNELIYEDYKA